MSKVKEMTINDLEQLIEHKLLELLGDPDSGLKLREEFKANLEQRLKRPRKKIPHEEVLKRFA